MRFDVLRLLSASTSSMPVFVPSSTILLKFFQPSVALYLAAVPLGTYNVALEYVLLENVFSFIANGFANEVDQLYNRLSNCPVPTTPVYGRTPIFTCNNNGCGCGCGGNF